MPKNTLQGVRPCVADTLQPPGSGVVIAVSAPGVVRLVMQDNSVLDVYANAGTAELDGYAVKGYRATGTTAAVTSVNIY